MRHIKNNSGYILILTMMIIAGATAIVTYIFNRGMVHIPFVATMIAREKAKLLALGGVQVGLAQLSYKSPKQKKDSEPQTVTSTAGNQPGPEGKPVRKNPQEEAAKKLLTDILPQLNRFQSFELQENRDGVDAVLEICIMSEEGKINLNEIFDFKTNTFKGEGNATGDWKKLLQELCKKIDSTVGTQNVLESLNSFLKKREGRKLDDVTELLTDKECALFKNHIYYEPPHQNFKQKKRPLYLTDIFTVHTTKSLLNPWFFSDSLLGLLDIRRAQENDVKPRKAQINTLMQKFKLTTDWKKDWAILLKPWYEKDLPSLPKGIESFLTTTFDAHLFSIRVHATVQGTMQHVFALVERTGHSQNGEIVYACKIKKLYWL